MVMTEEFVETDQTRRNFRSFMLIWVAQLVARIGNGLTAFGLGVHAWQTTHSTTAVAMITMAAFLPSILLAPLGGVLADRMDRRLLMILGDSLSAVGLIALLVAFSQGWANTVVICACVAFGSVFSSVMDPAYRATVTDLLTPEQYARAGGLVQFASASQYLISPALAGFLMAAWGIELVLLIDVSTMAVTIVAMLLVWRTIRTTTRVAQGGFVDDLVFGFKFLANNRGITILMLLVTLVTFCMGFLQTLLTPMMLDFSTEEVLGVVRSVAAVGMVVSSLAIGIFNMGNKHTRYMAWALVAGGVSVFLLGATTNVWLVAVFAFVFFMVLPPLSTSVEVLTRSAIPAEIQGRVWGFVGLISQLGYILAYALSGLLADQIFNPLLVPSGPLADSLGQIIGVGDARGVGLLFMVVGVLMASLSLVVGRLRSIREIETNLQRLTESN